jgi:hypothetical protein
MDWFFKAALTAATVLLVMLAARRGGRRWAGVVAALPTITAPTLAWIVHEDGVNFAVSAAVGSTAACGMLAVFALVYARAAQHRRATVALVCGLGAALAMALPAFMASGHLIDALALAITCCVLALAAMPKHGTDMTPRHRSLRSMLILAAVAGGLAALAAAIGPSVGGFATGLLASLPLITGSVAMFEHTACGHCAATHFLRGYVGGLFGKAAFGAVFAWLAPHTGAVVALTLACACACLMSTVRARPLPLGAASLPAHPLGRVE